MSHLHASSSPVVNATDTESSGYVPVRNSAEIESSGISREPKEARKREREREREREKARGKS